MTANRWITDGRDSTRVVRLGVRGEALGYLVHCLALAVPGMRVPVFTEPKEPGKITEGTTDPHLDLVITEARGQLDRQHTEFAEIRSRALGMTAVALTELGLLAGTAKRFTDAGGWPLSFWIVCFAIVVLGLAGMGSIASSRADFYAIDIPLLLATPGELRVVYANELASCIPLGHATLDARRTVFRDALLLMALGALAYGILWIATLNH